MVVTHCQYYKYFTQLIGLRIGNRMTTRDKQNISVQSSHNLEH